METMLCMGLCAISEVVMKVVVSATASRACSCKVLVFGWTMLCKWGHPVATLPLSCALRATLPIRASTAQTTPPDDPRSDGGSTR
eukprot:5327484-Pleurochrysis_carterae.AAC.1